jgi:hypothetical protein
MSMLGAVTVGTACVNFMGNPDAIIPAEKQAKELGRKLAGAIKTKWIDEKQARLLAERKEHVKRLVQSNKDIWENEYRYWKGRGELE